MKIAELWVADGECAKCSMAYAYLASHGFEIHEFEEKDLFDHPDRNAVMTAMSMVDMALPVAYFADQYWAWNGTEFGQVFDA